MSKKSSNVEYSKFWLGQDFDLDKEFGSRNSIDLLRLSMFRRAISNFVFILTEKNIPVRFSEKSGMSLTDGKVIYIGGDLSHGEFDTTVGLSLHEAMHIVKSDFDLIKLMWQKVPRRIYDLAGKKLAKPLIADFVKYVLNVVEDRFIDAWAYESAPGYRGYYIALYNKYFNVPKITAALKSDAFRTPTIKSYKFRLTNLTNPESDLDALPGLREIYNKLDLDNILRLGTQQDRIDLAVEISEIIIRNIVEEDEKSKDKNNDSGQRGCSSDNGEDGDDSSEGTGDSGEGCSSEEEENEENDFKQSDENIPEDAMDDPLGDTLESESEKLSESETQKRLGNEVDSGSLSDKQMEDLEKIMSVQEDFVNRNIKQKSFDAEMIKKLDILESSGTDLITVGGEMGIPKIDCVVVRKMSADLIDSGDFPLSSRVKLFMSKSARDGVDEGIILGKMLGTKLQLRNESRTTKFNRLERGKFDKRFVSSLGYGCEKVFYQLQTDKFKKVHMHISVDASSSMDSKWKNTMRTLVAMAKAGSMIDNLDVVISFRTGTAVGSKNIFDADQVPYIVIAYDSRVDKFSKIVQLFPKIFPNGSTPEGLTFQAILDSIPPSSADMDTYFVNISDGQPMFSNCYFGIVAQNHTKHQVNKIRSAGISVLSYFVGDKQPNIEMNECINAFKVMYGKDSNIIDTENLSEIARTMNKKFLENDK